METDNVFAKANGRATAAPSNDAGAKESDGDEAEVRGEGPFNVRDLILLDEMTIAPGRPAEIVIKPTKYQGRSLIHRIVMHKSVAGKLALTKMMIGERDITKGSGSCEIFLVEVPNYTPQKIYIEEDRPFRLFVVNRNTVPLNVVGEVCIFRRENGGQ